MRVRPIPLLLGMILSPVLAWAQGMLENPAPGAIHSGIGMVAGWHCTATTITVRFDQREPVPAVFGSPREDTRAVCGDANNGFVLQWNWALLGEGLHTVAVLADGQPFASATIWVATLGTEFQRGAFATVLVPDFPRPGEMARLRWQESTQSFVLTDWDGQCHEESDCSLGEYCRKPAGACDGPGQCQDRATACGADLAGGRPVCGCDGRTYTWCGAVTSGVNIAFEFLFTVL